MTVGERLEIQLKGEREARSLRPARERHRDNGAGALGERIVTQNEHRSSSRLLFVHCPIEAARHTSPLCIRAMGR